MITDLGSYALADFLPFSLNTYLRLFALHNAALAPLHYLLGAIGLALLIVIRRGGFGVRAALVWSAACWLLIAWAFHWQRYTDLIWAGSWFAILFTMGAGLLLLAAADRRLAPVTERSLRLRIGLALSLTGMVLQPLSGVMTGRDWDALAWYGTAPDPTVIATAGLLLLAKGRWLRLVWLPIATWLIVATLTALALGTQEYLVPVLALPLVGVASVRWRRPVHG